MNTAKRREGSEVGQVLILTLLVMTVVFIVGFIAVDLGFWVSERRGAQSAADFSALGGVQELLDDGDDLTAAFNAAVNVAIANDVNASEIDGAPTGTCSLGNSCINVGVGNCREDGTDTAMPWVEARIRRPGAALFARLFGVGDADVGAVARACVGSIRGMSQLSPFGIQSGIVPPVGSPETDDECLNETDDDNDGVVNDGCPLSGCMEIDPNNPSRTRPVYGAVCILKTGAQGGVSGQRGQLTIGSTDCQQTSANTLRHDFHYGTDALCTIGQEVNTGTGNILGLLDGLNDRLVEEGLCDARFGAGDGMDDFSDVFSLIGAVPGQPVTPSADNVFSVNDCAVTSGQGGIPPDPAGHVHTYTPRKIDLIIIDEIEQGSQTATITGFAAFYVIGCYDDAIASQTKTAIEQDLSDFHSYLNQCHQPRAHDDILGIFIKSLAPPEAVGDPDENLPLSIVLVK
ncbi:MAG TPA: Tad domain-containing protein [Dehalococcoidia bacterium]|nr:Tad domain-containing protein [Dehalococcoidia bacterium]